MIETADGIWLIVFVDAAVLSLFAFSFAGVTTTPARPRIRAVPAATDNNGRRRAGGASPPHAPAGPRTPHSSGPPDKGASREDVSGAVPDEAGPAGRIRTSGCQSRRRRAAGRHSPGCDGKGAGDPGPIRFRNKVGPRQACAGPGVGLGLSLLTRSPRYHDSIPYKIQPLCTGVADAGFAMRRAPDSAAQRKIDDEAHHDAT